MQCFHLVWLSIVVAIVSGRASSESARKDNSVNVQKSRQNHDQIEHVAMFNDFLEKHNKSYGTKEEYHRRLRIFRANLKKIAYLQETEQGTAVYGPTVFADLTRSEFKKYYLGFNPHLARPVSSIPIKQAVIPNITLPKEYDWRHYNAVTAVKNQGMCGSCWAFSTTGNIEGVYAAKNKDLVSLSEQELVDCDKDDNGCGGGLMTIAFESIITKLGGLESESDYPYKGSRKACHIEKSEIKVQINSYVNVSSNETDMAKYLVQNGPMAVAINANAMQFYFGGVSHPLKFLCRGGMDNLDHGVLIVGYGVHVTKYRHKIQPYWIIKNSWGPHWGEQGYYRLYRGDGSCGINDAVSSAVL